MNSTHKVEIVPVQLLPHPNADTLSIVRVWNYTVVVRTAEWQGKTLGAYIPPDNVVPDNEMFAFLGCKTRITVRRFRGVISYGLLMPAPEGSQVGDDVAELLGVTHYEPPLQISNRQLTGGEADKAPSGYRPSYDVDSAFRYAYVFERGEMLFVTEKVHGANARFCWHDGRMHCGSRTEWKKESAENLWWRALKASPSLGIFCQAHPDITVYGEVYGQVQNLKYGHAKDQVSIAVFDLLRGNEWLAPVEARLLGESLPWVPTVATVEYESVEQLQKLAIGNTLVPGADHIREGIVVKPMAERYHPECGRVCLKLVSPEYLEGKFKKS